MGAIPTFLHDELQEVVGFASDILEHVYVAPTVFEHGPSEEGQDVGCGVDHAHFHLVPLRFSLLCSSKETDNLRTLSWVRAENSVSSLRELHQRGKPYLYIREPGGDGFCCIANSLPCQSLRRVIARSLGVESKYDYNDHCFLENVSRTIQALKPHFLSHITAYP
jgi:hypothetical protein